MPTAGRPSVPAPKRATPKKAAAKSAPTKKAAAKKVPVKKAPVKKAAAPRKAPAGKRAPKETTPAAQPTDPRERIRAAARGLSTAPLPSAAPRPAPSPPPSYRPSPPPSYRPPPAAPVWGPPAAAPAPGYGYGYGPAAAPPAPTKRFPVGVLVAGLGTVAVVAVAVVLVFVVGVFRGSSRPRVTDAIQKLVLGKSQIPSDLELDNGDCPGPRDAFGLKDCYAAFYKDHAGEPRVFSAAFSFSDASSASGFEHRFRDAFSSSILCPDENGRAVDKTVTDQPSPGLGDESLALVISCPNTGDGTVWAWRVDNVVQMVGADDPDQVKDLAGKIEARK